MEEYQRPNPQLTETCKVAFYRDSNVMVPVPPESDIFQKSLLSTSVQIIESVPFYAEFSAIIKFNAAPANGYKGMYIKDAISKRTYFVYTTDLSRWMPITKLPITGTFFIKSHRNILSTIPALPHVSDTEISRESRVIV